MSNKRISNSIFIMFLLTGAYCAPHNISTQEFLAFGDKYAVLKYLAVVNCKKQLFINVGTAKNFELWCDSRRVTGEKSQDLFNVVAIDTYHKHIRVIRIGAEWNRYFQHRVAMCLDYAALRQVC